MRKKLRWFASAAVGLIMGPLFVTPATADDAPAATNFSRENNIGVNERARPGYEALGTHAGGFYIYPRLSVGAVYDDNIFATKHGISDTAATINPEVFIKSNWSRNELTLLAHGQFTEYGQHSSQSTSDYGLDASGRLDILRGANVTALAGLDHATEARTDPNSPAGAAKPVQFDVAKLGVGAMREFNRLRVSGKAEYEHHAYQNTITNAGVFLRQNDRDEGTIVETAQADYAVSPATAVYLQAAANQVRYRYTTLGGYPNRNSDGYNVSVGTNFDITHAIRGDIRVGYLSQSYKFAGFGTTSGLSAAMGVDWFPSELTTVNLSASRSVQEAVTSPGALQIASGYLSSVAGVRVDHELLRNVLLNAHASYEDDAYQHQDRTDKRTAVGVGGIYLLNRSVGLKLSYDHLNVDSSGLFAIPAYRDNKVAGSLTLQY